METTTIARFLGKPPRIANPGREPIMIQVTDTVRVVHSTGLARIAFLATVLSVQPSQADDDGTNGEPTITIGFLDPKMVSLIGGPDWHKAFKRIPTVRHVSHADAQKCASEYCYVDHIPGEDIADDLNMDDLELPPARVKKTVSTIGTIVYINHNNGIEVKHEDDGLYGVTINDVHSTFSDLFSAQTYVDAQPKPEESAALLPYGKMLSLHDMAQILAIKEANPARTVEIGEYPEGEGIEERFSVKIDGIEKERFKTREEAQEYIDKMDSEAPEATYSEKNPSSNESQLQP